MKALSLNCQRGYQPGLREFLRRTLEEGKYDFLLLQEFAKEVPSFVQGAGEYDLLLMRNDEVGELSQTCIVYRKSCRLLEKSFVPFAKMRRDPIMGFKHATFGSLFGRFQTGDGAMLMGSTHLHSGIDRKVRAAQVGRIKEQALSLRQDGDKVIFGGGCNFGLPGERARAGHRLAPQFACVTKDLGPTLDSRYSENVPHLPNRIAAFFSIFNIKIPLWTDQAFADAKTVASHAIKCRILPERVSDHSPIEIVVAGLAH